MENFELRSSASLASSADESLLSVEGLVNKSNSWSKVLGVRKKFREKINKGAFDRAIKRAKTVDLLYDHNKSFLLSTTDNGSLDLWEDEEGLQMRAQLSPTSYGKDTYVLIKDKVINHMSFGFKVIKDSWKKGVDGIYERTIEELDLREVSVVRNPAYSQSMVEARGIEVIEDIEIPDLDEDLEERSIDIDELKATLKAEILKELQPEKIEEKVEEVKEEKPQEQIVQPIVQIETEKVVSAVKEIVMEMQNSLVKPDVKVEKEPEKSEEVKEESNVVEEKTEEKVEEKPSFDVSTYINQIKENQKKRL